MGGIGVRVWELAQSLSQHIPVTIVAKGPFDLQGPNIRFLTVDRWEQALEECTAAVFYDMPDTRILLAAHRGGKRVITDSGPPIEHLEYGNIRGADNPDATYRDVVRRYELQVLLSDHFIIRSEVARATTVTALSLMGRLAYANYSRSSHLEHLFSFIPIGFNAQSDRHAEASAGAAPMVDFVWSGGIWDFYDPLKVVSAVARLRHAGTTLTVRFMYAPPHQQGLYEATRLSEAVSREDLGSLIELWTTPISHEARDGVMKRARAAVLLGKDGIENYTSIRLRIRDTFLYRLPLVVDKYGATGEFVRKLGIGLAVNPDDEEEVAHALRTVARDDALYMRLRSNIEAVRGDFMLEPHVERFLRFLSREERAPDINTEQHRRRVEELLAAHPDLERSPWYPI